MSEATGESPEVEVEVASAEAVKEAIEAVPVETRVDLTTVEMMSAFGDTWIWTDVTPDQAQEVYKMLGEPTATQQLGEPELNRETVGQVVEGTVVEHTGGNSQVVDEAVDN